MASIRDYYGAQYMNSERLAGKTLTGVITEVEASTLRNRDGVVQKRIVLTITNTKFKISLNKTNALNLAAKYGEDFDTWEGKKVQIRPCKRQFGSKDVDAIEVLPAK